jgi:hypothetical protein
MYTATFTPPHTYTHTYTHIHTHTHTHIHTSTHLSTDNNMLDICWVADDGTHPGSTGSAFFNGFTWFFFFIPMALIYVFGFFSVGIAWYV